MNTIAELQLQRQWAKNAISDINGLTLVESKDDKVTDLLWECENHLVDAASSLHEAIKRLDELIAAEEKHPA